ncbi:flavin monoamine oxidase family protein [Aliikangiella coralliicola]|uniref:Tryptophan 2-monooxygenase n=1 Tax=Aliikangiella coralliicola TaxID=2592383 RepID=A0A545UBK1_9GAMM|nr:flavin monoamine oxidase family protein [Aliikangiella coralliicola]TQV86842.1 flavin monoamine oxidase family protein [Aliikangiella coralliicola]
MTSQYSKLSRREFLAQISQTAATSALIRAATAMGITASAIGCGSSSNANSGGGGNNPPPVQQNPSPRPADWPAGVGSGSSVIILGAGIAGMVTAFEMSKLGFQVTILEAQANAGGRCKTLRSGDIVTELDSEQNCLFDDEPGLYFNPGPARIPHHHDLILGYCREFGVALEPFINENKAALFHSTTAFNGQPQIARQIIADTRGYIGDLLAKATRDNVLNINLSVTEQNNLIALLQQFGSLNANLDYQGTDRAGYAGQENAGGRLRGTQVDPISLNDLLASNFWQSQLDFFQSLDQQSSLLQPVGGMDNIARAFEQRVADSIIYSAEVSEIRKTSNGVNIVYRDATQAQMSLQADYCVCSIPATVLRNITNDFSAQHASAINNFVYSQSGKLAFQSRRFWEQDHNIYGGISWTDQNITQIWYPSAGYGQQQGIIVGAYTFGAAAGTEFANLSPSQRVTWGTTQAGQLHNEFLTETSAGISVSWPKMPYQLGAWGVSDPGVLTTADDNILFAGEHLSQLQGWQEGAVLSAYNAIDQIVSLVQG